MAHHEMPKLRSTVRDFSEAKLRPIASDVDEKNHISWAVVKLLAREGLFKYVIPVEYGGAGIECQKMCLIREELARVCLHADQTFAMSGIASYPITRFGTEEQKLKYLPDVATGKKIGSFSLTEPKHGSDVANIETSAISDGNFYLINGKKCFASNAAGAYVCPVFVRTGPAATEGLAAGVKAGVKLEKLLEVLITTTAKS